MAAPKAIIYLVEMTVIQTQLDQLVYKLYSLTEEEIKIVEGSIG